ncbi:MAG TPA: HAD hydrolase family protein [Pyrinomonadaceae bacterium]|nr:HAD hydrolase family protein [Pyrinomonadaceae bacterium]
MILDDDLRDRAFRIKLLLMDCDGVLTDGRLYFGPSGEELRVFHARDGQGIVDWHAAGFQSGIISGRNSAIVEMRAKQLGITYIKQGRKDKSTALDEIIAESRIPADQIAFVGDDTPDIQVFERVAFAVAVADAHDLAKSAAHYTTEHSGGHGAVREVTDMLLAASVDQ